MWYQSIVYMHIYIFYILYYIYDIHDMSTYFHRRLPPRHSWTPHRFGALQDMSRPSRRSKVRWWCRRKCPAWAFWHVQKKMKKRTFGWANDPTWNPTWKLFWAFMIIHGPTFCLLKRIWWRPTGSFQKVSTPNNRGPSIEIPLLWHSQKEGTIWAMLK